MSRPAGDDAGPPGPSRVGDLIAAKLAVPSLPRVMVVRAALAARLRAAAHTPVVAVTGPAGYGKTALVAHWTRTAGAATPTSWLSLDERDNAPATFWAYLLQAIRAGQPHPPTGLAVPDRIDRAALRRLAADLVAERTRPLTVIIDRAEVITNRTVAAQLDTLLRYAAPGLRLVVVGRSAPLLPLYRYRLAGELVEIQTEDLALTAGETADIVAAHGLDLSPAGTAALHARTEGWVTGVCLHALAAHGRDPAPGSARRAGGRAMADYLRGGILDAQLPRAREVLLRTSIVERIDADLAIRLSGRDDARVVLDELARANAFVQTVDDGVFRCRAPLRAMLRDELATWHPELVRPLHLEAARWYRERGRVGESLEHATRVGAWAFAADLAVADIGVPRLVSPAAAPYRSVLARLPADEAAAAAWALRPVLALAAGDLAAARAAAAAARDGLRGDPPGSGAAQLALRVAEVVLARYAGDAEAAGRAAAAVDVLRGQLPPTPACGAAQLRALLLCHTGVAEMWSGRLAEARALLTQAAAAEPDAAHLAHDALANLALLHLADGTLEQVDAYAQQALALADAVDLAPAARAGAASAALAGVAFLRNEMALVSQHLSRAAATTTAQDDPPTATALALLRAQIAARRRDIPRAVAALAGARANLRRWRSSGPASDAVDLTAARVHLVQGDGAAARRELETVSDGPERTLLLACARAEEGDPAGARRALVDLRGLDARPPLRQMIALTFGRLAFAAGDVAAAARALRDALDCGRPEQRRRPVIEEGAWVRRLIQIRPDVLSGHDWLAFPRPRPAEDPAAAPVVEELTDRETEVLDRLAAGLSSDDIADDMYLSVNTVKTHLRNIYRKLGTPGRSAAARRARELNLLPRQRRGEPAPPASRATGTGTASR
ncbi:hypothetical protein GCM10010124_38420 [Pilimelia terevasa]|uniref:HTH luxR-type domain-containing protein n=1 Tax=Pilimelia terevasa TaxID=53372 RepID=A0A8J3FM16_9ACTN|nr:LuxR C-terminal-related transcriptional regulator [Pilimelia terevasa]GGK41920.1 hypothetical protein GCM10010124_38420 [Pilimelia terevasa]